MSKIINTIKTALRETDFVLFLLCTLASLFGITMVYSATRWELTEESVISRDTRTMILAVAMGMILAVVISFIDYNFITKMFPAIGAVCILLMLLTLAIGVGPQERPDAKTWLVIGNSGLYFQPSELVKIGFIITFGMHIELVKDKLKELKHILLLGVHAMIPTGLVVISGDLGSALVFIVIFVVMMFCAGVQLRYFILGFVSVIAATPAIWYFLFSETQKERFLGLIYPERYADDVMFQQLNGLKAIARGGFTGQGLFNGTATQSGVIPESENDMIFTCVGEELGLLGCIAALGILLAIVINIMHTGQKSKFDATALMCYGLAAMIAGQVIINIGMCLVIMPVIGITLPFFSAGGSSNLCIYIGIGLIMSIYRFDKEKEVTNFRLSNITTFSNY